MVFEALEVADVINEVHHLVEDGLGRHPRDPKS